MKLCLIEPHADQLIRRGLREYSVQLRLGQASCQWATINSPLNAGRGSLVAASQAPAGMEPTVSIVASRLKMSKECGLDSVAPK